MTQQNEAIRLAVKKLEYLEGWQAKDGASVVPEVAAEALTVLRPLLDQTSDGVGDQQVKDNAAVDRFANAMKKKLALKAAQGRSGWDDPEQCSAEYLNGILSEHIEKGDPVDVGNIAMMLFNRGEITTRALTQADQPAQDAREVYRCLNGCDGIYGAKVTQCDCHFGEQRWETLYVTATPQPLAKDHTADQPADKDDRRALDEKLFRDLVDEAMNDQWSDWCSDTGCFPDDFQWKGGNGTLEFTAGKWASHVADQLWNRLKRAPSGSDGRE